MVNMINNYYSHYKTFAYESLKLTSNQCNDKARVTSASIDIYNIKGQRVKSIPLDPGKAGEQFSYWDGRDEAGKQCSSGIYFIRIRIGTESRVHKMLMMK